MAGTTIPVQGLKELDDALASMSKATARNTLRRAGLRALEPFLAKVKELAPVSDPEESPGRAPGTLRDSYIIGTKLTKRQARLVRKEGQSFVEVYAGTTDPAGIPQEFGTEDHAAQPHVRPAWDTTSSRVLVLAQEFIGEEIEKTRQRAAARAARRAARSGTV
ncbi:HK97 gp10 family phage protein [Sphingomonas sanxanigenens]|uniref:HK97 gp10 family phage protein n=1 Tax=Sphingomonas sanxanigenens DSM 19645 = NX02 TaxID=1123269 RepID=W0AGY9_9SPHN|nr:HK97 gp10 family phage protein [Sphingomonas sanxanigenens]AHE55533.1 hypothetical protein NX02_19365 [Sphingomonas sanxanigenens DSM 19645 = NX02]